MDVAGLAAMVPRDSAERTRRIRSTRIMPKKCTDDATAKASGTSSHVGSRSKLRYSVTSTTR